MCCCFSICYSLKSSYIKITSLASRLCSGNLVSLVLFLAPFIATKSKARKKPTVESRSILSILSAMPKKIEHWRTPGNKTNSSNNETGGQSKWKNCCTKIWYWKVYWWSLLIKKVRKFKLIENVWIPHADFKFSTSEFTNQDGVTKSYCCQWIWLKNRTWLTYSPSKDSLFYLRCLLFGSLKKVNLASTGLKYWVSANSELGNHANK